MIPIIGVLVTVVKLHLYPRVNNRASNRANNLEETLVGVMVNRVAGMVKSVVRFVEISLLTYFVKVIIIAVLTLLPSSLATVRNLRAGVRKGPEKLALMIMTVTPVSIVPFPGPVPNLKI